MKLPFSFQNICIVRTGKNRIRFVVILIINVCKKTVPVYNTNKNKFFELGKLLFIIVCVINKLLFLNYLYYCFYNLTNAPKQIKTSDL